MPDPSLKWVENAWKGNLKENQKEKLIKELQKCEGNFDSHNDGQARIENRENCIFRLSFKGLDTVSYNRRTLKENRIKEMIADMTKKFGNQVLGVHG